MIMTEGLDRRSFLKRTATIVGIVLTPLGQLIRPAAALAARKIHPYRFIHGESVAVVLDYARRDDRYDLAIRHEGEQVEFFANADPTRLHRLNSDYFTVEYVEAPA